MNANQQVVDRFPIIIYFHSAAAKWMPGKIGYPGDVEINMNEEADGEMIIRAISEAGSMAMSKHNNNRQHEELKKVQSWLLDRIEAVSHWDGDVILYSHSVVCSGSGNQERKMKVFKGVGEGSDVTWTYEDIANFIRCIPHKKTGRNRPSVLSLLCCYGGAKYVRQRSDEGGVIQRETSLVEDVAQHMLLSKIEHHFDILQSPVVKVIPPVPTGAPEDQKPKPIYGAYGIPLYSMEGNAARVPHIRRSYHIYPQQVWQMGLGDQRYQNDLKEASQEGGFYMQRVKVKSDTSSSEDSGLGKRSSRYQYL